MTTHDHPLPPAGPAERAKAGGLVGTAAGLLLLGIGVLRIVLAAALGRRMPPLDGRAVAFALLYILSFVAGGVVVGLAAPLRHRRWGRVPWGAFALGYLGAGVVCAILAALVEGARGDWDVRRFTFVAAMMTTTVFGTVAGYQVQKG